MKKILTITILSILVNAGFCQTIEKLEYELSYYKASEKYGDKIEKARKLQSIDPFNERAIDYICRYYYDRKIDSISIFWENLIAQYPNNAQPYILRSQLLSLELDYSNKKEYYDWQIRYLNAALKLDKTNQSALYYIAKVYYNDFLIPFEKPNKGMFMFGEINDSIPVQKNNEVNTSNYEHSADSALKYFYNLWEVENAEHDIIYFPIKQLECYLGKKGKINIDILQSNDYCYFPSWYFANLSKNWECDNSIDYLFELEMAKRSSEGFSIQLSDLREPCLYNKVMEDNTQIYRFTWLRSFDPPISIRIEKQNSNVFLFWKVGKGAGGYAPKGLKKSGKKKLSENEWTEFQNLVKNTDFDNLPNEKYIPMCDGASWTLEKKSKDSFKAHDTNEPSGEFKKCCLYLLKLTRLKVKEEDIY